MTSYYRPYWLNDNELEHFGILGMKWGIRRYQNKDGSYTPAGLARLGRKNLQKAKIANFDKWGNSAETNTLWITGYSGSGKTTAARSLMRPNDKVIHLDVYADKVLTGDRAHDKDFDKFLDKTVPRWKEISTSYGNDKAKLKYGSKEYWNTVDKFSSAIDKYSKQQYKIGNRVIVEGIQIADGWLRSDYSVYKDKPIAILSTNRIKSLMQALSRDHIDDLGAAAINLFAKDGTNWSLDAAKNFKDIAKVTSARKNPEMVLNEYLEKYGQRRVE